MVLLTQTGYGFELARSIPRESGWAAGFLLFRRENQTRLAVSSAVANPVADVEEGDEEHERDQRHGARALDVVENSRAHGPPANRLDQRQQDVSAIKHREWQHVEQRQIHVEDHAEPEHAPPAVVAAEEGFVGADDHERTAELLEADVRLARKHRFQSRKNLPCALANLIERGRIG